MKRIEAFDMSSTKEGAFLAIEWVFSYHFHEP